MKTDSRAEFRFYAQLNDFLPTAQRQRDLPYHFTGRPGIKDPIEVFGVPHPEVGLIVVNRQPVGFDYQLQTGDRVAVYPLLKHLDTTTLPHLRVLYLTNPRFVLDVNLGKLAKWLRFLGFDSLYRNDYSDPELVTIAAGEQRIVLTRDRRLLFAKAIEHGYWVRAVHPEKQLAEVLQHFDFYQAIRLFARCAICNGQLQPVAKAEVFDQLAPKTKLYYQQFHRCTDCRQIYWQGSHIDKLRLRLKDILESQPVEQWHK